MSAFNRTWDLMMKEAGLLKSRNIDSDENDDEFIDNEQFSDPVNMKIEAILGFADPDLRNSPEMCYSCGFEGTRTNFMRRTPSGRLENRCPECGSYSIHGRDAYRTNEMREMPDRSNETYEEELARRNAYYRKIEEENRQKKTGVGPGNE